MESGVSVAAAAGVTSGVFIDLAHNAYPITTKDRRIDKCRKKGSRHTPCAGLPHTACADYIGEHDTY